MDEKTIEPGVPEERWNGKYLVRLKPGTALAPRGPLQAENTEREEPGESRSSGPSKWDKDARPPVPNPGRTGNESALPKK